MNTKIKTSCFTLCLCSASLGIANAKDKPLNVIYILVDDLGYGDLGCYGQKIIPTPNIDKMASDGMLFTQHYSGSTVSAPSRCALMTGLHTGHSQIRGNKEHKPEGQTPMSENTFTLGKLFKNEGYVTAMFGKWGLGYPGSTSDPNKMGFDEFYGNNCQRVSHSFYPNHLWHNQEKVLFPENYNNGRKTYSHDLIHNKALSFIRKNKENNFFAMLTYTLPHAELAVPKDSIYNKFDKIFNETPSNAWKNYKSGYYPPEKKHTAFAAMVARLDMHVGEILAELNKLGIADNTLVIFTSDNGPHVEGGADPEFFDSNGPLRGVKRDLYEGGIRVPMIAWSPKYVPAGTTSNHVSAFWDMMPTFADFLNVELPTQTDGISILPTLADKGKQKQHEYLYWEYHEGGKMIKQSIRKGNWKFIYNIIPKKNQDKIELFKLNDDLSEQNNLADKHPSKIEDFKSMLKTARVESTLFPREK